MTAWYVARGMLAVVTLAAIVFGIWQVAEYLGGFRTGYERWLYAPFMLAAVTGIIVIRPRRAGRHVTRPDEGMPVRAVQSTTVNPWAVAWFIALGLVAGAAQLIAFLGMRVGA